MPTQPFILTGSINRVPTCPVGVKAGGGVTSVGWQITLCDPTDKWRPIVLTSEVNFNKNYTLRYLYLYTDFQDGGR